MIEKPEENIHKQFEINQQIVQVIEPVVVSCVTLAEFFEKIKDPYYLDDIL